MPAQPKEPKPRKPRTKTTAVSKNFATKVGNGNALLLDGNLDGRSLPARRFRELTLNVTSDLGGADRLSEIEKQLVKRFSGCAVVAELAEASIIRGEEFDVSAYCTLLNAQNRLATTLGLQRRPVDVAPTLEAYLASKAAEASPAAETEDGDERRGRGCLGQPAANLANLR